MNIQEIDKWLDNEYGTSYTRLGELHDYFFEKYTDQKEEIERLNNIIKESIKLTSKVNEMESARDLYDLVVDIKNKLKDSEKNES